MYVVLQSLHIFSNLSKNIATEVLKKTKTSLLNGFLLSFLCASVAKRDTPEGDFTTAYIFKSVPKFLLYKNP